MPLLVDGNNLLFALKKAGQDAGRSGLCDLLANLSEKPGDVTVVFDGPAPRGHEFEPPPCSPVKPAVEVVFSGHESADDIILDRIEDCTAPRRLVVVSTDHVIRRAARRRRCQSIRSEDFVPMLLSAAEPRPKRPREPGQKYRGLSEAERQQWLKEFGLEDEEDEPHR